MIRVTKCIGKICGLLRKNKKNKAIKKNGWRSRPSNGPKYGKKTIADTIVKILMNFQN